MRRSKFSQSEFYRRYKLLVTTNKYFAWIERNYMNIAFQIVGHRFALKISFPATSMKKTRCFILKHVNLAKSAIASKRAIKLTICFKLFWYHQFNDRVFSILFRYINISTKMRKGFFMLFYYLIAYHKI